jgi:two-component system invasion response regulator UvrY
MLKILAKILALEGNFTLVGTVTDGQQAVRQALNMKPELVLMDYSMPHVNGIEATRSIKQFQNPPLVIIVTSNDTPECKAQAKAAGADGFVVKGGDLHEQLRLVFQDLFQFAGQTLPCPGKSKSCRLRGRSRRVK